MQWCQNDDFYDRVGNVSHSLASFVGNSILLINHPPQHVFMSRVWLCLNHMPPVEVRAWLSGVCSLLPGWVPGVELVLWLAWQVLLPTEYHSGHISSFDNVEALNLKFVQKISRTSLNGFLKFF